MLPWEGHTLVGTTDTKGPVRGMLRHNFLDSRMPKKQIFVITDNYFYLVLSS